MLLKVETFKPKLMKTDSKGLNLEVKAGEVHAIMGPNGAGKSTSQHFGRDDYEVTAGTVDFDDEDLVELAPDERT